VPDAVIPHWARNGVLSEQQLRRLWFLTEGGIPNRADQVTAKEIGRATAFCVEGDSAWRRIRPTSHDIATGVSEPEPSEAQENAPSPRP
jgi:hypothetical protein